MCALCAGYAHILARLRNPLQGFCPSKEGGLDFFVTQHGRHKSKSRNADFIIIAPKGETTHYILRVASAPSKCFRCAPQGRYHNLRAAGPSNPPRWEACHWILSRLRFPANPVPLPPQAGGQKIAGNPLNLWGAGRPTYVKQISLTSLLSSCIMVHVVVILCR